MLLDDNTAIYVEDNSPTSEPHYRARFSFDPNSIPMGQGEALTILRGLDGEGAPVFQLSLGYDSGSYRLRAETKADDGTDVYGGRDMLSDEPHTLEIEWQASSAAGADDGLMNLWIDGTLQGGLAGLDNDTLRAAGVQLGAVEGIDEGARGSCYFDAFESRRQSYIGPAVDELVTETPTPTATQDVTDRIFVDGFESGDLSAWTSSVTDGGDLSAAAEAALEGGYGLKAVIDDKKKAVTC